LSADGSSSNAPGAPLRGGVPDARLEGDVPRAPLQGTTDDLLSRAELQRTKGGRVTREREFQVILFRVLHRELAIPIQAVEWTEHVPGVMPVPRCPAWVRGVANLRGGMVTVVDLRRLLEDEETPVGDARSILLLQDGARRLAVLCESLPDFSRVVASDTRSLPESDLDIYSGAIERNQGLVGVLDTGKLFDYLEERLGHGA
jgi:purine-binding chemotaxis protein CheW